MTQNLELELQKSNLKVQALLQTTSELHNQIAEYRAEVTMLANEVNRLNEEAAAAQGAANEPVEEPQADATTA